MEKIRCKNYKTGKDENRTMDYIWTRLGYLVPYYMIDRYKKKDSFLLKIMEEQYEKKGNETS